MKLVVGLGNPGKKYQSTRHNVGFDVLAAVAKQHSGGPVRGKFQGDVVDIHCAGGRAVGPGRDDGDGAGGGRRGGPEPP
mgnify:CR=1 FL=1